MSEPEISDFISTRDLILEAEAEAPSHSHTRPTKMWEVRVEYQASDGRWLRLAPPGLEPSYYGSSPSKAMTVLLKAWAEHLTPEYHHTDDGTELSGTTSLRRAALSRLVTGDTETRIVGRLVPDFRPFSVEASDDFSAMLKKGMRTLPIEEPDTVDPSPVEMAWADWGKRLREDKPKKITFRDEVDEDLRLIIERTDGSTYADEDSEPMLKDVPIELLPETEPRECRWCGRPVEDCPFPDDEVAHGL